MTSRNISKRSCGHVLSVLLLGCAAGPALAAGADQPNNGTDPTRLISTAALVYEYNDLANDLERHAPRFDLILPFGEKQDYSLRLRVPVIRNDVFGDSSFNLGDVSLTGTHVFGVTPKRGMVVQGEYIANTADRPELGTGRHVFKGTFIYARFLPQGIFAPALVHSVDLGGDTGRADVSITTMDFYYVPKLKDPRNFVTIDPSLNFDWENNAEFASLAVTAGRTVGQAFGGITQVYIKPSVLMGHERPGDWSVEVGFKVLGF